MAEYTYEELVKKLATEVLPYVSYDELASIYNDAVGLSERTFKMVECYYPDDADEPNFVEV